MTRDCVAVVTWTGEGDVNVLVEEPSGTVCSLRTPRTSSGGILIGDDVRQAGRDSFGGRTQPTFAPRDSTANTGCWSEGCGATSRREK